MKLYNDIANEFNLKGLDRNIISSLQTLLSHNKFSEIKAFIEKLNKFPMSHEMLVHIVSLCVLMNLSGNGIDLLNKMAKIHPNSPDVLVAIADYYFTNDSAVKGMKMLKDLIMKLEKDDVISFFKKGAVFKLSLITIESIISLVIEKYPSSPDMINILGFFLKKNSRYEEAVNTLYKSIALDNTNPIIWQAVSECLANQGLYIDALKSAKQMRSIDCHSVVSNRVYAEICVKACKQMNATESEEFKNALRLLEVIDQVTNIIPDNLIKDDIHILLKHAMEFDESKKVSMKDRESYLISRNTLVPLMCCMDDVKTKEDRITLLEMHKKWAANQISSIYSSRLIKQRNPFKGIGSKINLGISGYGFRNSIIGKFVKPLIKGLDKSRFNIYIYALGLFNEDEFSNFCLQESDKFKRYVGPFCAAEIIAKSISDDNVDVSLDVGVGLRHAMYKSSKVSIAWLDYPHSSGMPVDYMVVDPYVNPNSDLLLEKPLMLPESWVCMDRNMFGEFKIEDSLPSDRMGYITFGTMNASFKVTEDTLKSWARIMHMVPNSKFLYSRPTASMNVLCNNFCIKMSEYGINPDRIMFAAVRDKYYMNLYNHIDVALDTFPRTGGTTTCETLWMGVPVVTLVGEALFERLSYSNLMNIGASDLCAFSVEEYERIAVEISQDRQRRLAFRRDIRERILQSPLGDSNAFIDGFSKAIVRATESVSD